MMFEINLTMSEQLRNARDLKPFIDSLEIELAQVREQFKALPNLLEPQENEILTAIREITAKRQQMAGVINQLSDKEQQDLLTAQYIEGIKTKDLSEFLGLKDKEIQSIRRKAIKNLEQVQNQLGQSEA
ncbi:DNA-directed RNA polymerase specialized sigma24 family protein [Streptococcus gallinaceus]|uniref:sigma-70 family RNA polymerase sigma factor n=1 Tax=Streptococcus gallinaceus TaxID=165758 RepID=UPI00209F24E3|nr:sigma-70 family RNA polymerase sigma factor [Streptococcus gallinaceus]MCP1640171.1 DNA-directed RNA polymerase specialized sigma24 family protein [Streptococcus gallinaceus]MCP1770953.1 DNA-directed RNA polymerase specialized sigma24 family protein [Streptococcus gallinaceus]